MLKALLVTVRFPCTIRLRRTLRGFGLAMLCLFSAGSAWPQASAQVVTDNNSYNAGSQVRLKVQFGGDAASQRAALDLVATLRYAGESRPLLDSVSLAKAFLPSRERPSTDYLPLWKIPFDARAGRYEVEVAARDPNSHSVVFNLPRATSFSVYRKLVKIDRIQLDRTFYTSGDPLACRVTLKNLYDRPLDNLRVEFSDRYWPWIAQSSERVAVDVFPIVTALSLRPGAQVEVRSSNAGVAKTVQKPTVHQYAVVVWDQERKNIYDIAFSPPVFIHPPGVETPKPYGLQYVYPELASVDVSSYRHFRPAALASPAVEFDRSHTMFAAGNQATVTFSVWNPTNKPWPGVTVVARLLAPDGRELRSQVVVEHLNLDSHSGAQKYEAKFDLPAHPSGIYRAVVEMSNPTGFILAANELELGVNPLPKSILIFCAHQDDEGAHLGIIRAAAENNIPIHFVYFTSGDAGSCDRYYQHSCDPSEALNFGALRMEEARATLGHLGILREDIFFLGLPDGGSGQIWFSHVDPSNPYLSVLLASDHAPYEGSARPNLSYARQSVVGAAKEFIKKFQPEVIYTGHPDERHVDHRTNNWFVVKALQELLREGVISSNLMLLTDQVYGPGPQAHAPYHYQKHVLSVSGDAMALGQEAQWYYQSQDGNHALGHLRTFENLPRTEVHWQILDWKDHEGWNEKH